MHSYNLLTWNFLIVIRSLNRSYVFRVDVCLRKEREKKREWERKRGEREKSGGEIDIYKCWNRIECRLSSYLTFFLIESMERGGGFFLLLVKWLYFVNVLLIFPSIAIRINENVRFFVIGESMFSFFHTHTHIYI